jgi:uncharacterized protein
LTPDAPSPKPWLVLMMKAPRPGFVKTRLADEIGAESAVNLYRRFVELLVRRLFADPARPWQAVIAFDPPEERPLVEGWLSPLVAPGAVFLPQSDGDLGDRLRAAFSAAFDAGAPAVLALGADCLEIEPQEIESCFRDLRSTGVLMGPAHDGGYWSIGMSEPRFELFEDMPWSGPGLAEATRRKARELGLRMVERAVRMDIDQLDDLRRLPAPILVELNLDPSVPGLKPVSSPRRPAR